MRQGRVRLSSFMCFPTPRINPVRGGEARLRITSLANKPFEKSNINKINMIMHVAWMVGGFLITARHLDTSV
jgi:hypothetical protein